MISFQKNIFQYSKRTIASTETNDTSKESLILSFLELESLRVWHYQEGSMPTCHKKTLKKVNLMEESRDAKKKEKKCANLILITLLVSGSELQKTRNKF